VDLPKGRLPKKKAFKSCSRLPRCKKKAIFEKIATTKRGRKRWQLWEQKKSLSISEVGTRSCYELRVPQGVHDPNKEGLRASEEGTKFLFA